MAANYSRRNADRYPACSPTLLSAKACIRGKVSDQNFGTASTSAPRQNLLWMEEDLSQAHLRLSRTYIEHLSWQRIASKNTTGPYTPYFTAINVVLVDLN
ncbi:hypothetical protein [Nitrosomonas ureae]|uniref:hypothetical protein n=1 Tax=Nitrosomonas ureae TaxID=44577 RepID=UPI000943357E|nr:hypothetical protein [Nitrosomonas ureae]